jgi:hypothetical protein
LIFSDFTVLVFMVFRLVLRSVSSSGLVCRLAVFLVLPPQAVFCPFFFVSALRHFFSGGAATPQKKTSYCLFFSDL